MRAKEFINLMEYINKDVMSLGFSDEQSVLDNKFIIKAETISGSGPDFAGIPLPKFKMLAIEVVDAQNPEKVVATAKFKMHGALWWKNLQAKMINVVPDYRRQGIATAVYQYVSKLGNTIKPSNVQLTPGQEMWKGFNRKHSLGEQGVEEDQLDEKWSEKYKKSINCNNPRGFSQRAHCQGRQKKSKSEGVAEGTYPDKKYTIKKSYTMSKDGVEKAVWYIMDGDFVVDVTDLRRDAKYYADKWNAAEKESSNASQNPHKPDVAESDLDRFKKYIRPVVKTTPKIEKTTNPAGRSTDHVEWIVTSDTGEKRRFDRKKQAQEFYDLCTKKSVAEGKSNDTAISLSRLGKFHPGADTLAEFVPERATAQYALHPDKWESTFYSLTNKDSDKLKYYGPKKISIPPGTLVGDMAIANKFYRAKTPEEKQQYAEAYKASLQPYPVDVSEYRMPELLIPRQGVAEGLKEAAKSKAVTFFRGEPILSQERLNQLKSSIGKPYPILRKEGSAANIGTYMSPDGNKATSFVQQALAGQGKGGTVTKIQVDPNSFSKGDGGIDEAVIITNIAGLVSDQKPNENDPLRIQDRKQAMLKYLGPGVQKYLNDPLLTDPKMVQRWYNPEFAQKNWNTIKSGKQAVTKPGESDIQERMISVLGPLAERIRRDPEVISYFIEHNPGNWIEYNFRMNSDGSGTKVVDVKYYPPAKQGVAEGSDNIPTIGINVRDDGDIHYADLIVDGKKKYESRKTDSLRPYVGKTVGIVRTGNGPAVAIGQVTIGEPIVVDAEKFNRLRKQHLVPQGSKFDIDSDGKKYLYPMIDPVRWDYEKTIKHTGIVSRKIQEQGVAESLTKNRNLSPETKKYIQNHKWTLTTVDPMSLDIDSFDDPFNRVIDIDTQHPVNFKEPIIVHSDGTTIIDGFHRVYQAQQQKLKQIPAYVVVQEGVAEGRDFDRCFDQACKLYDRAVGKHLKPKLVQVADFQGDGSGADPRWGKLPQHVWQHYVVIVGDQVLDPTAQQFGPDMPKQYPVSDLDRLWGKQYQIRPRENMAEGLKVDVPNENWLQDKIDYAKRKGRNSHGVPYMGTTTAYTSQNTRVPVDILRQLPGMRGEQQNVRQDDLKAIMKIMKDTGKLPLDRGQEYAPFINVAWNGEAWVNEGNHRIMAASALGWKDLPVQISYFDGGERVESGAMYPGKIGLADVKENLFLEDMANRDPVIRTVADKQGVAEGSLNEASSDEAWELVGQPVPEIQQFVKQMGYGNDEQSIAKITSIIDRVSSTQIPATSIPKLKNLANKGNDAQTLKAIQQISGRPDAEQQYTKLMQARDAGEGRNRDVSGYIQYVKSGNYDPPVLLKLPTGVYVIGGRTRLYAALALGVPANVKIISANNFKQGVAEDMSQRDPVIRTVADFYINDVGSVHKEPLEDYVAQAKDLLSKVEDKSMKAKILDILKQAKKNPYIQGSVITAVGAILAGSVLGSAQKFGLSPTQTNMALQAILNTVIPTMVSRVNGRDWPETLKYTLASVGMGVGSAGMMENFKDGKNPQDKGDSARHGIPKNATISQLKKIRSSDNSSPRKKQLAHWQINMRQGRK